MAIKRMRSLPKAAEELRQNDPDTCVTLGVLRRLVKEGKIPFVKTGKNYIIDMNDVERFLEGGC